MTDSTAIQKARNSQELGGVDFSCNKRVGEMSHAELFALIDRRVAAEVEVRFLRMDQKMDAGLKEIRNMLTSAFPAGNPEEHRRYHEEIMAYMEEKRALWRAIREKTLISLAWAALVALGSAVWHYIKVKLGAP